MIHFPFQIIPFFHVYDSHSHTKPATRLRLKNVGIALSNRRESMPLIVAGVGDQTSKISRNKVDGLVQNF